MTNPTNQPESSNPAPEDTNQEPQPSSQVGDNRDGNKEEGPHDQEDTTMGEANQDESSTSTTPIALQEQEAILRKEVEESLGLRFKQDNPSARVRAARKKRHEEALENLKALQNTLQALKPAPEREVVPRNMPGLQVLGGPERFEDRDMHESITAFFTAFEAQLYSHRLDLNQHWERLFWQCLDNHQRSWF